MQYRSKLAIIKEMADEKVVKLEWEKRHREQCKNLLTTEQQRLEHEIERQETERRLNED
jgi:hypothetical protein